MTDEPMPNTCEVVRTNEVLPLCPSCRKVLGFGTQWYPFPG